jgi:hypothetical protein
MKKLACWMIFAVLLIGGVYVISRIMPQDQAEQVASYSHEVPIYVPPQGKMVEKFEQGGLSLVTIGSLAAFQSLASKGSNNFMTKSVSGG